MRDARRASEGKAALAGGVEMLDMYQAEMTAKYRHQDDLRWAESERQIREIGMSSRPRVSRPRAAARGNLVALASLVFGRVVFAAIHFTRRAPATTLSDKLRTEGVE
jgi:hypothetical protein